MSQAQGSVYLLTGAGGSPGATPDWANVVDYGADPTGNRDSIGAFQAAIATGRTVYVPAGNFQCNKTNQKIQLTLTGQIMLGDGAGSSIVTCATAMGATVSSGPATPFIVVTGDNLAAKKGVRGIFLQGPHAGTYPIGPTQIAGADGIAMSMSSIIQDCCIQGFDHGLVNNCADGHSITRNCEIDNNWCNYFMNNGGGDDLLESCVLVGAGWCSFGVTGNPAYIGLVTPTLLRVHTGSAPFAFYQEAGGNTNFVYGGRFYSVSMEAVGNRMFHSDSAGVATGDIASMLMEGCWCGFDTSLTWAYTGNVPQYGAGHDWFAVIGTPRYSYRIHDCQMPSGTAGKWNVQSGSSVTVWDTGGVNGCQGFCGTGFSSQIKRMPGVTIQGTMTSGTHSVTLSFPEIFESNTTFTVASMQTNSGSTPNAVYQNVVVKNLPTYLNGAQENFGNTGVNYNTISLANVTTNTTIWASLG